MPAASKRAKRVHSASEYNLLRLAAALRAPKTSSGAYAWTIESIRAARDAQLAGNFRQPAQLAAAMRTDDACFVAYQNRLAPQRGLPVELVAPSDSARARKILDEAGGLFGPKGVGIAAGALESINGDLANHGVAFGVNVATPREDGSRIDIEHHHWPIEWVRWDAYKRCFMTQVEPGTGSPEDGGTSEVPICHGDGRWVVYTKHEHEPWRQEACVLPGALVWAGHAFGSRDRSKAATAIGNEKWLGTMPKDVEIADAAGNLSPEASAMLDMLEDMASLDNPIGLAPEGSKVDRMVNGSTAWQIFKEILDGGASAAGRIYNGQDATMGSNPTGPGVDAAKLWGVRNDIVEGDLGAIERGLFEGVISVWCALNFGDSRDAPWRSYQLPDPDEDARQASLAARTTAFFDTVRLARANGFQVTPEYVTKMAKAFGVVAPPLPDETSKAPSIALAPTDIARVVSVNEARASAGLGVLMKGGAPDPDGLLTVEEFAARLTAPAPTGPAPALPAESGPQPLRALAGAAAAPRRGPAC